jgi:hypothetical protein
LLSCVSGVGRCRWVENIVMHTLVSGALKHFGMQATAKEYQNFAIYNRKQTDGDEICNLANVIQRTLFGQITIA